MLGIVESDTKTHDDRKVPIPASVVELLRTELPTESESLVFPGREGGYLPSASSGGHSTKPSQVCNLPPPGGDQGDRRGCHARVPGHHSA